MTDTITIERAVAERAATALECRIHFTKLRLAEFHGTNDGIIVVLQEALKNDEAALAFLAAATAEPAKPATASPDARIHSVAQVLLINSGLGSGTCVDIARKIVAKLEEKEAR